MLYCYEEKECSKCEETSIYTEDKGDIDDAPEGVYTTVSPVHVQQSIMCGNMHSLIYIWSRSLVTCFSHVVRSDGEWHKDGALFYCLNLNIHKSVKHITISFDRQFDYPQSSPDRFPTRGKVSIIFMQNCLSNYRLEITGYTNWHRNVKWVWLNMSSQIFIWNGEDRKSVV